jgi:Mce-associated membrane protein
MTREIRLPRPGTGSWWWKSLVVAVVFAGLGAWFLIQANSSRGAGFDTAESAEVTASVTNSLNKIFSYSYDRTEVTGQAADAALRGGALTDYRRLFDQVREMAPRQHLVVTTRVVDAAAETLTPGRAVLLVFLDQSAVRGDHGNPAGTPSTAASQLAVTAERSGGAWFITDLTPR